MIIRPSFIPFFVVVVINLTTTTTTVRAFQTILKNLRTPSSTTLLSSSERQDPPQSHPCPTTKPSPIFFSPLIQMTPRVARIIAPTTSIITLLADYPTAAVAEDIANSNSKKSSINKSSNNQQKFLSSLTNFFPGSIQNTVVKLRIIQTLRKRGYRQYNTLFGTSLCVDEVLSASVGLEEQLKKDLCESKDGGV